MLRKNVPEVSGAAGFIAHEQLHVVQVKELGHVETKNGVTAKEISREFQRQFRLAHPGWAEK